MPSKKGIAGNNHDTRAVFNTANTSPVSRRLITNKKGRPPQNPVSVLWSHHAPIPSDGFALERVVYDTGLVKRGRDILLGDDWYG